VSPPQIQKRGRVAHISHPATMGPRTLANPKPTGVGNGGWRGRSPLPGGLGDVPPNFQRRGKQLTLVTPPRGGPRTLVNPQPTRVGQGGPGGKAPWQGVVGGVPPHKFKRGGELPTLATRPRVGPRTLVNPQPTRVGQGGSRGRSPLAGVWGMCPKIFKLGDEWPSHVTPPRVGPRTLANPKPTGVGKPGGQGAKKSPSMGRLLRRLKPPRNDLKSEREPDLPGKA